MQRHLWFGVVALVLTASGLAGGGLVSQDEDATGQAQEPQTFPDTEPGERHARLAKLAGEYTTSSTFTFPGSEPAESSGTATIEVVLDGRFVQESNTDSLMGEPTSGMRLMGFNNITGEYEANWVYTADTGMLRLAGKAGSDDSTIRLSGKYKGPEGAEEVLHVTYVFADDDGGFTVTISSGDGGETDQAAILKTTYTRSR